MKKSNLIRLLALLLSALMVLTAVACGTGEETLETTAANSGNESEGETESEEETESERETQVGTDVEPGDSDNGFCWWWIILLILLAMIVLYIYNKRKFVRG